MSSSSLSKRESRFHRYLADPVLLQDDPNVESKRPSRWDVHFPLDHSHSNLERNAQFNDRERQFSPATSDNRHLPAEII